MPNRHKNSFGGGCVFSNFSKLLHSPVWHCPISAGIQQLLGLGRNSLDIPD